MTAMENSHPRGQLFLTSSDPPFIWSQALRWVLYVHYHLLFTTKTLQKQRLKIPLFKQHAWWMEARKIWRRESNENLPRLCRFYKKYSFVFCSHGIFASVSGKQTLLTSFTQRNVCCRAKSRICLETALQTAPPPCQHLVLSVYLILPIQVGVEGYLIVVLICWAFFFKCLLAILYLHAPSCWNDSFIMGGWFLCSLNVEMHRPSGFQARQFWPLRRVARWNTGTCFNLKFK